ncbi:MAG TPA: carboxypeptidase-like regulatory domain-containing protein, partial [Planctomycetota bacterium]|nr:carboxypeptidase-like regulatory domain-containing protein [Planctomycetota bacterium]
LESLLAGATGARMVDTDALGKFRIEGLLPREYRIDAMDPRTLAVGRVESAPAGLGDVRVEIPAGATHARVAGRVVDREGAPLAGIRVRAARTTFRTTSVAYTSDLPTVTTDDEGRFEIRNVARDEVSVEADGDAVIPASVQAPFDAPADLRIVVLRRCHLQVELASSDEADSFAVLDGAGARLTIRSFRGSTTHFHPIATLTGGRSLVVGVEETATTLVLLSQGKETRRVPLALKPGELAVVRP